MTMSMGGSTTVREVVSRYPQTRQVFERLDIDYCCHGARSLVDAAEQRELPLATLQRALSEAIASPSSTAEGCDKDWLTAPLAELVEHIVHVHHQYVKAALPRLRLLIGRVLDAHGTRHGDMLRRVQSAWSVLEGELSSHLMKEEQILFPYIAALEQGKRAGMKPRAPFGAVENPVRQMEHEHESAGKMLRELREATDDYSLPDDACETFKALFDELQRFESDLHEHIHLENNLLFPRAIAMEQHAG